MTEGMPKLKKYHPESGRISGETMITFNRLRFAFSQRCRDHLQRKDYCVLFFSEDKKTIAIKPYQIKTEDTLKITGNNDRTRTSASVACKHFIRKMKIADYLEKNKKTYIQVQAFWDDKQKAFLLKLDFLGKRQAEE